MIMLRATSKSEITINQPASGPLPKTIGKGPMKITMLELDEPLLEKTDAIVKITMPKIATANPKTNRTRRIFTRLKCLPESAALLFSIAM
jgi:hypothetical protein